MENNVKKSKGRPLGSKNKTKILTKNNSSVISIKMEKQVEGTAKTNYSGRGWVNWGLKNDYPLQLSNLYYNSPIHQSCVDFAVSAILGNGVDYDKIQLVNLQASDMLASLESGQIDFFAAWEPWGIKAEEAGGTVLFI